MPMQLRLCGCPLRDGQGGEQSESCFPTHRVAFCSVPPSARLYSKSPCEGQHSWPWCCPRHEEIKHKIFALYYQRNDTFMYLKELLEMLICTVSMDTLLYQQRIKLSMFILKGITLHFLK